MYPQPHNQKIAFGVYQIYLFSPKLSTAMTIASDKCAADVFQTQTH